MAISNISSVQFIGTGDVPAEDRLIDVIGTDEYVNEVKCFLRECVDLDDCLTFGFPADGARTADTGARRGEPKALGHLLQAVERDWVRNALHRGQTDRCDSGPVVARLDPSRIPDIAVRDAVHRRNHVRDVIVICGARRKVKFGVVITRSVASEPFSDGDVRRVAAISRRLTSSMSKHIQVLDGMKLPLEGLRSLEDIENVLLHSDVKLPRREREVCSYILYGVSIAGIALSLGIAEESVVTYRKRSYQRLGIGSRHELLLWYLALASDRRLEGAVTFPFKLPAADTGRALAI